MERARCSRRPYSQTSGGLCFDLTTVYNFRNRLSQLMQATWEKPVDKAFQQVKKDHTEVLHAWGEQPAPQKWGELGAETCNRRVSERRLTRANGMKITTDR